MPSAVIGYETYFCPQQIKSEIKDVGGAAVPRAVFDAGDDADAFPLLER